MLQQRRGPAFWLLTAFFACSCCSSTGPTITIVILSFQGPSGGLTFPMRGVSLHWFGNLFEKQTVGDFAGSLPALDRARAGHHGGDGGWPRSRPASPSAAASAARRVIFYLAIASLIVPSILISLGIGLLFRVMGIDTAWYSSAFGAHLTWTLPFGLLIMFAVFNRFDRRFEEAARDLGATSWQTVRHVVIPILLPSLIGVGLFGFTLSYDEFARSLYTAGHLQHPAARDLRHDHQRHHAGALCAGHGDDRPVVPGDRAGAGLDHHPAPPPRAAGQRRRQGGLTWLRRARVLRLATAGPQDTAPLAAAIDRGEVDPATIVAIVGKTEGNGCVNDFTRGYATLALKLLLAERAGCPLAEVEKRVAIVMSGGTEGGLSPHLLVFCREEGTAAPSAPRLAIGVGLTRAFKPEEIGRRRADRGDGRGRAASP